mmetsp:Transcript_5134/g.7238  ORF Transcript_5134/g.7238 Transcript_5134/m.7238 type:complete len:170 (-) Transcript_5134:121-630(-)
MTETLGFHISKITPPIHLPRPRLLKLSIHIAGGMAFLHTLGPVHQLHLTNILIKEDTAKIDLSSEQPDRHFSSPEEIMNQQTDKQADMWKLGIVLLVMWSRGKFVPTETLAREYTEHPAEIPKELHPASFVEEEDVATKICECLKFQPGDRPEAKEVLKFFEEYSVKHA